MPTKLPDYSKWSTRDLLNELPAEVLLGYMQKKEMIAKNALSPILNESHNIEARQQLNNLKNGGTPQAVAELHRKTAMYHEGLPLPLLPNGQVDTKTALQQIQKSVSDDEARQLEQKLYHGATEHTTTTVEPSGRKTVTGQFLTTEGEPISPKRIVSTEEPNVPEAVDKLVAQKDKKNHERGLDTAIGALRVARNVLSNPRPSNAEDGLLIDSFLKAANPSAVIRPSMIDFVQKQTPFADQLKKKWDQYLTNPNKDQLPSGAILTETDRRQLAGAFQQFNQAMSEDSRDHYAFLKRRAEKQNLGKDLDEIFSDEEQNILKGKNFVDIPDRSKVTKVTAAPAAAAPMAPAPAPAAAPPAEPGLSQAQATPAPQPNTAPAIDYSKVPKVNSPAEAPDDAEFYMSPDGRRVFVNRKFKRPAPAPAEQPAP